MESAVNQNRAIMNFSLGRILVGKKLKKSIPNPMKNWSKKNGKKLTKFYLKTRLA
jgi:hypothetical protein